MNYDAASKQITFAHMLTNALYSLKETTIPALSTMIINAKFKGTICYSANPVATIYAPTNPTISGIPALVTLDKYKHCILVIDNCAPYDITLARNEVLGVLEFEPGKCIPLNEKTISGLTSNIHGQLPKVPKKKFTRTEIEQKANLKVPVQYKKDIWTFCLNIKMQSALISLIWAEQKILHTKFTSRTTIQCMGNNSKFQSTSNFH